MRKKFSIPSSVTHSWKLDPQLLTYIDHYHECVDTFRFFFGVSDTAFDGLVVGYVVAKHGRCHHPHGVLIFSRAILRVQDDVIYDATLEYSCTYG